MTPTVLVLNAGSSSIRYQLVEPGSGHRVVTGLVERIGDTGTPTSPTTIHHTVDGATHERALDAPDHATALRSVLALFEEVGPALADAGIVAVGHRVVMGADVHTTPVRIDDDVIATIDRLTPLAPLHNPPNLAGITVARELFPDLPHVAVFDTAFFHDLPPAASTYALDRHLAGAHGIRRYGAHGTSHRYVSEQVAEMLRHPRGGLRQIVLHLGNGASASAVVGGRPVETSMGFTPLEGLVMGTRTGDIDPSVVVHLLRNTSMSLDEVDDVLHRRSGLLGLSGHNDMRDIHRLVEAGDPHASLALDVYGHRLRKYIGAYTAVMGGIDALTFTAGVGENDPVTRTRAVEGLGFLGITVDPQRNAAPDDGPRIISPEHAPVTVLVVPTDEELAIARDTLTCLGIAAGS